ncbi:WxL protein peptidoglycan domain-containing protein [Actinoallomurus iriomotensis]|uniref:DUF916 domain-containing protein n=1 Tax=Actinoallomurus iriomotensis TaxID=478107 RepID=A0A9W6VS94_9ACTN|nr:DUF916 domain-containing protein [Actinoallomurus iriomotensis]GLY83108.1 hypothetical protein Airi02_010380 [Actinoallomurus iriomotensis]
MHLPRPRTTSAAGALTRAAVVTLLAVLGLLGAGADPAAAADGDVPWTVGTAAGDFGAGRPNYSYTLDPGGRLQDGLVVTNHGTTPLRLAVYAADGFTTKAGQFDLVTKDAKSTGVGAWVHPDRPELTIRPGESVQVPFTVTLPDDAAPGDHMGGIVTSLTRAGTADPAQVDRRVGIRIRLRVGGPLKPSLSVERPRVRYSGTLNPFGKGEATVTYTIHNTGNAILTARQAVSVSGPLGGPGVRAGGIGDSPQLLPGDTWKVSVPVRGVAPALRLTGTVTVTPLIADAAGSIAPLAAVRTTTHAWNVPWVLLLLLVLCALIAAGLAFRRRRTRRRLDTGGPESAEEELREPETSDH